MRQNNQVAGKYKGKAVKMENRPSFWKKYKYLILIVAAILITGIGYGYLQRVKIQNSRTEEEIPATVFDRKCPQTDSFYYEQLTERQKAAYDMVMERCRSMEGGMIVFDEPLNGEDYSRLSGALTCSDEGMFYGFIDAPLKEDNYYLKRNAGEISEIKEQEIRKVFLFLYSSEGLGETGTVDDRGYLTNAEELDRALRRNDPGRLKEIQEIQEKSEAILTKAVAELPEGLEQKEAVDWYIDWLNRNLTYDEAIDKMEVDSENLEEEFRKRYFASNISCVAEGRAVGSGYARTLTCLLNRSGIPSYNLIGSISKSYVHGVSAVRFGEELYFVDASPAWEKEKYGHRYFTGAELGYFLAPMMHFTYK